MGPASTVGVAGTSDSGRMRKSICAALRGVLPRARLAKGVSRGVRWVRGIAVRFGVCGAGLERGGSSASWDGNGIAGGEGGGGCLGVDLIAVSEGCRWRENALTFKPKATSRAWSAMMGVVGMR